MVAFLPFGIVEYLNDFLGSVLDDIYKVDFLKTAVINEA